MTIQELEKKLEKYPVQHKEENGIFWVSYEDLRMVLEEIIKTL